MPHALAALGGLLLIANGCEKLVGISDTEVTQSGDAANYGLDNRDDSAPALGFRCCSK